MKLFGFSAKICGMLTSRQAMRFVFMLMFIALAWPKVALAAAAKIPVSTYFVLDNGLQVLLQEKHDLPLTAITLAVNLGVKDETEISSGYVHLFEHVLLFGSSIEADGETRLNEFRSHGIVANAHTDHDLMTFDISCPASDSAWALTGLRQAVFNNSLDQQRLEKEKRIILEEILQLRDNPQYLGRLLLMQNLFAGHPYSRSPFGDGSAIKKATVDDLRGFGKRFLIPGGCALAVIGDFLLIDMEKQVRESWGILEKGNPITEAIPPANRLGKNIDQQVELDLNESHLFLGWWAPDLNHEHRLALGLLTYVLGRGLNPLFNARLRGERSLVEQLDMSYMPMYYGGMVGLHVILKEKNIQSAKNEIARFLSEISSFNFSKEDYQPMYRSYVFDYLESAKNQMTYDSGNFSESALNLSNAIARFLLLNRKQSNGSYLENVEKINSSDLRRVAANYLSGKKLVALAIVPLRKGSQ